MAVLSILLTVIIVAASVLMVMLVLIQRPKQEGLGAAFGGSTLDSALGAHTTDILQKITTWLGIVFFISAIGLAMVKSRQFRSSAANNVLEEVQNREPVMPNLPSSLSDLPGGISLPEAVTEPAEGKPAPANTEAPKEKGKAKSDAKAKGAEKGKGKAKAKAKQKAPAAPTEGAADKGKAKGKE